METASERLTRESGTSFYYAFRILPAPKRRAIFALYSFCRAVDDCVDEADGGGAAGLDAWLAEVDRAYAGRAGTEVGRDLAEAVHAFPIPRPALLAIVEGCRMDLVPARYPDFAALRVYCERVASAVGLASIEIFGYRDPATRDYARELGLALQLTNILRDVRVDAARDRIYVPLDELKHFGVSAADFLAGARAGTVSPAMQALLAFQGERALASHARAASLLPRADRRSLASARIMGAVYLALLHEILRRGIPLTLPRVALPRPRKLWIALRTLVEAGVGL